MNHSSPDMLPMILDRSVALARLPRQANSQNVGRFKGDCDLVGPEEGEGGDGYVGKVDGRHLHPDGFDP